MNRTLLTAFSYLLLTTCCLGQEIDSKDSLSKLRKLHTDYLRGLRHATSSPERYELKKSYVDESWSLIEQLDGSRLPPDDKLFLIERSEICGKSNHVIRLASDFVSSTNSQERKTKAIGPLVRSYLNINKPHEALQVVTNASKNGLLVGQALVDFRTLVGTRMCQNHLDDGFAVLSETLLLDLKNLQQNGYHSLNVFTFLLKQMKQAEIRGVEPKQVNSIRKSAMSLLKDSFRTQNSFQSKVAHRHAELEVMRALGNGEFREHLVRFAIELSNADSKDCADAKSLDMITSGLLLSEDYANSSKEPDLNALLHTTWNRKEGPFKNIYLRHVKKQAAIAKAKTINE